MAGPQFPAVHELQYNIASIAIGQFGIRQADTDVVFDATAVVAKLECVSRHCLLPRLLQCVKTGVPQSARNTTQAGSKSSGYRDWSGRIGRAPHVIVMR